MGRIWQLALLAVGLALVAGACAAAPTPEVIEKEVVVTQVVEKEVEKVVEVEKEVEKEVVVTPTPLPPIKVCGSAPLTGRFAEPGNATREGYEYWAQEMNQKGGLLGRQVEVILLDNASDPDQTVAQYEQLITEEGCELLLGPFSSALTGPGSAVGERHQMVFITPAGGAPPIYQKGFEYVFGGQAAGPLDQVRPMFELWDELNYQPTGVAILNDDDFFANFIAQGAEQHTAQRGFEVINRQTFPAEGLDYTPIAQAANQAGAVEILFGTAGAQSAIGFMQASAQVRFNPDWVFQSSGPDQIEYLEALGPELAEGVISSVGFDPAAGYPGLEDFVEGFTGFAGHEPFEDNATGYTVGQILEAAVLATRSLDNTVLKDWLHTPGREVQTVQGKISWAETGESFGQPLLVQWQGGELKIIWPAEARQADPITEKPWP